MNGMAAFAQGFNDRREENSRRRSELADAFTQFRQANPHATMAQMQQWMDAKSGGRNYLRGGMPSGEVLQGIADENAKAKAFAEQGQRLERLSQRNAMTNELQSTAMRYMRQFNGDVVAASEAMRKDLGGDMAGMDLTGMFTPEAWNREVTRMTHEYYPMASSFVKENMTLDNPIDPKMVADQFSIPLDVAKSITERAKLDLQKESEDRAFEVNKRGRDQKRLILQDAIELARQGVDPRDAMGGYFNEEELTLLPDGFIDEIVTKAQTAYDQEKKDRVAGAVREANGSLATAEQNIMADFQDGLSDEVRGTIQRIYEEIPEDVRQQLDKDWVEKEYQRLLKKSQGRQDAQISTRYDTAMAEGRAIPESVKAESLKEAEQAPQGNPRIAARELARDFYMTPEAMTIAVSAMESLGKGATAEEMAAAGRNALMGAGVTTLEDRIAAKTTLHLKGAGAVEADMTPEQWQTTAEGELQAKGDAINTMIETAMGQTDVTQQIAYLKHAKAKVERGLDVVTAGIKQDIINAPKFITWGTGGFNRPAAEALMVKVEETKVAKLAEIDKLIAQAEADAKAAAEAVPEETAQPAAPVGADPMRSPVGNWLDTQRAEGAFNREYGDAISAAQARSNWLSQIWDKSGEVEQAAFVKGFLNTQGVQDKFMKDPAAWAAFKTNPEAFFKNPPKGWEEAVKDMGEAPKFYE